MKYPYLLIFFLFFSISGFAQIPVFQKHVNTVFGFNLFNATERNGNVVACAGSAGTANFTTQPVAVMTDSSGVLIAVHQFGFPSYSGFNEMCLTGNGDLVCTGYASDASLPQSDLVLVRCNSNGSVSWIKQYNSSSGGMYSGRAVRERSNTDLLIAATGGPSPSQTNSFLLMKTDAGGNVLQVQGYDMTDTAGGSVSVNLTDMLITNDNGTLVLGYTYGAGNMQSVFVMKTDSALQQEWTALLFDTLSFTGYNLALSGSSILVAGRKDYVAGAKAFLLSLDDAGAYQGVFEFGDASTEGMQALGVSLSGNEVVMCGGRKVWNFDLITGQSNWVRRYNLSSTGSVFYDVSKDASGALLVAGYNNPSGTPLPFLMSVSNNGLALCDDASSGSVQVSNGFNTVVPFAVVASTLALNSNLSTISALPGLQWEDDCGTVGLNENPKNDVVIFPQPANDQLFVSSVMDISRIRLFNLHGMLIYESEIDANQSIINTAKYAPGVYMLEYTQNGTPGYKKVTIQ